MQDDDDNVQCPECDRSFTSTQGLNGHLSLRHAGRQKRRATSPATTVVRQTRRRTGTVANDDESQFQMELPMNAVDTDVIDTGTEEMELVSISPTWDPQEFEADDLICAPNESAADYSPFEGLLMKFPSPFTLEHVSLLLHACCVCVGNQHAVRSLQSGTCVVVRASMRTSCTILRPCI
jgi:hypothetical protein